MTTLIDTHSHLYDRAFDEDRDLVVARALDAGVSRMFLPAIDSQTHQALFALCDQYPGTCYPMMGLHPTSVNDDPEYMEELEMVRQLLGGERKFYAVGEVGLDLYWSRDRFRQQVEVFRAQIELSLEYGLPLAIHTREAWGEMTAILEEYKGSGIKGIMHSFSGELEHYRRIKDCGDFIFGIGGVVTYKKSTVADQVTRMDLQDMVLETDCPYLPPVPFRGKRNESSYLRYICSKVAEIKGVTEDAVAVSTTRNALRIFNIEN